MRLELGSLCPRDEVRVEIALWLLWTIGLTAFFVGIGAPNLANFRPVSSDDVWTMSASHKLATRGIFGSDLYAGFFNADQHYFMSLPVHHFLQALGFRILGAGIAQARGISLLAAVLLIWIVGWLAYRWFGLLASMLSGVLLVLWRSEFIPAYPGLPLLAVARSGRYDLGAVAWVWLSIALLASTLRRASPIKALALGVSSGLAALTQFFGVLILPLIAIAWLWTKKGRALAESTPYWIAVGVIGILLPYLIYVVSNFNAVVGQSSLYSFRAQFASPEFYLENLRREPDRFAHFLRLPLPTLGTPDAVARPFSPWLLLGVLPAFIYLSWRVRRPRDGIGERILWLSALLFMGLMLLLDQTKAPLYAILLLPSVCLMVAAFWSAALHRAWQDKAHLLIRFSVTSLTVLILAIILLESERAYRVDMNQSAEASRYLDVGQRIDSYLEPNSRVLGAERWWWALHEHPYLALNNLWLRWRIASQATGGSPEFIDLFRQSQPDFVVVNDNVRDGLRGYPPALQDQFWQVMHACTVKLTEWNDHNYGRIEIYRVTKTLSDLLFCAE